MKKLILSAFVLLMLILVLSTLPTEAQYGGGSSGGGSSGGGYGGSGSSDSGGSKSRCLIATAAFGNELSPQVQFLRNFRDQQIMSTLAGSSFMNVFNTWYYSFSPQVANYEREQTWFQNVVRTGVYPLLGILQVSQLGYSSMHGEYGAVTGGLIASSMIGALYFWPFALSVKRVRTGRFNYKLALSVIAIVFVSVIGSIVASNQFALMVSTSMFVLSLLAIASIVSAKLIITLLARFRHEFNIRFGNQ